MADIEIRCERCRASVMLSEYAALDTLVCRHCGSPLRGNAGQASRPARLKLREPPAPSAPAEGGDAAPETEEQEGWRFNQFVDDSRAASTRHKPRNVAYLLSWLFFVIVGGACGMLRYGEVLSGVQMEQMIAAAPFILLFFHVVLVLWAFKDSIFQGILCLMIPGYSFVYLFLISDQFFLRALVAGLLVGLGWDAALFYQQVLQNTISSVSRWIASGG